jgi:hypothetical protein
MTLVTAGNGSWMGLEHTTAAILSSDEQMKRDRADSNNSSLTGTQPGRNSSGLTDTDTSRTDTPSGNSKDKSIVLEEDSADAPAYLFMYEQVRNVHLSVGVDARLTVHCILERHESAVLP